MKQFLASLHHRKPKEDQSPALLELRIVMSTNKHWPVHLIFMLCAPESESPTWYHVVGNIAPSIYRPEIESELSFQHPQFIQHTICTIRASAEKQVRKTRWLFHLGAVEVTSLPSWKHYEDREWSLLVPLLVPLLRIFRGRRWVLC